MDRERRGDLVKKKSNETTNCGVGFRDIPTVDFGVRKF